MDELLKLYPLGKKVTSPGGRGVVVGYINRHESDQVVVSLDSLPLGIFDRFTNPVRIYSYKASELLPASEIANPHRDFNERYIQEHRDGHS